MGHSTVRAPRLKDAAERPLGGGEGQHDPVPPHGSRGTPEQCHPICSEPPPTLRGRPPLSRPDGGRGLTARRATPTRAQTPAMTFCSGGGRGGLKSDHSMGKWGSAVTGFRTRYPKVWQLGMLMILMGRS